MDRARKNNHYRTPNQSSSSSSNPVKGNDDVTKWRPRRTRANHNPESQNQDHHQAVHEDDDNDNIQSLVGTCNFMCPEAERAQRERLRDLAVFERLHGNPNKSSPSLAVKKTSDVRPLSVLEDTLNYLLNLLDSSVLPFEVIHDFIFDRTRSIRQDLGMQNIANLRAICMYEKMVKFHVISHHKLRSCENAKDSSLHYLNMEQLTKVLTTLYNLYDANRDSSSIHENEAEFRSLYVLLHLDSASQPTGESLSLWFRRLPYLIVKAEKMCFAQKILRLTEIQFYRMGNYKNFFNTTAAEASLLQYYIIEPYINEVRALAVACINNCGYKLHPYPLPHLSELLMMQESDMESFCNICGLETYTDDKGNKFLPAKQTSYCHPKGGFKTCNFMGLEQFER
ncbi:hypothetical protein ACFE04_000116 [Oxalis oulophora]